jgi:antitoxin component YwqK of YwqJK toxin-antitoxin module
MKKIITILCLVLLSSCSQEPEVFTGPFVTRDGVKYDQNTNEPVTGIEVVFHENGQLFIKENYIDGELDGLYETFHVNGQLSSRSNFIDGERDGLSESFDENGNLIETETYRNGVLVE